MPIAAGLLFTTLLASGSQAGMPAGALALAAAPQSQEDPHPAPTPVGTPAPHDIGLGGFGGSGGGPSLRYFFGTRVGFDLTAGWYRSPVGGTSRGTSFQVAPSVIVMLNKPQTAADVSIRPYLGGGVNYAHASAATQTTSTVEPQLGGVGMQAFGGAEIMFASASSVAISAEVRYYKLAIGPTFDTSVSRGTDFYLLFHYYMR